MANQPDKTQVKYYLKNVLNYFLKIRQNYYEEHARLQQLNETFQNSWKIITHELNISDPDVLQRGSEGLLSGQEVHEVITRAVKQFKVSARPENMTTTEELQIALQNYFENIQNGSNKEENGLETIQNTLQEEHDNFSKKLSEQELILNNANVFDKIYSQMKTPIVDQFIPGQEVVPEPVTDVAFKQISNIIETPVVDLFVPSRFT